MRTHRCDQSASPSRIRYSRRVRAHREPEWLLLSVASQQRRGGAIGLAGVNECGRRSYSETNAHKPAHAKAIRVPDPRAAAHPNFCARTGTNEVETIPPRIPAVFIIPESTPTGPSAR